MLASICSDPEFIIARYWNAKHDEAFTLTAHQVRPDGIFPRTESPPRVGSLLQFELHLPALAEPVTGVVRVVHAEPGGVTLRFVYLDDVDAVRSALRGLLVQAASDDEAP